MPAPTLAKGYTYVGGTRLTPTRLNQLVDLAQILVSGPGKLPVRALASSGAGACDDEADLADFVTTRSRPSRIQVNGLTTLGYAASVALDFDTGTDLRQITLAGALTLTTSNRGAGKSLVLCLVGDGSARALTFPAGWIFVTDKPTQLAANKVGMLVLTCRDANDTGIVAAWSVQA